MKLSHADELLLHRVLDGEAAPAAVVAFEARLAAEPLLRREFEDAKALRAGFAVAAVGGPSPHPGFTGRVIAAALRLPSRQELEQSEAATGYARTCRRLLIAAAILFGTSLAWQVGLIGGGRNDTLQAAPSWAVQREMKRLDALIESGALNPVGPAESRSK